MWENSKLNHSDLIRIVKVIQHTQILVEGLSFQKSLTLALIFQMSVYRQKSKRKITYLFLKIAFQTSYLTYSRQSRAQTLFKNHVLTLNIIAKKPMKNEFYLEILGGRPLIESAP